jgi:folate-binding protein YgfZ
MTTLLDEVRALTEGCGLADRSEAGRLEMLGADRQRFLNAYISCDVKPLAPGDGAYGFLTSAQGRILSDAVVLVHPDRLWLEVGPGQAETVAAHLRKYVIVDRVEIRPLEDMVPLTLIGPKAAEILGASIPALVPEIDWKHARVMVDGTEVTAQRLGLQGAPAFSLWVSASIAPHLRERLLAREGVRPAGQEALDVLRVEAGLPRFGVDYGPDNFPQETGIAEAVSYTKGCYLGQEVVARIHYRGGVQKELRRLVLEGEVRPGSVLSFEGREAGTATTVVRSPVSGKRIGLGIVHKRAAEPGTRLEVEGGGAAVIQ